ncbi:sac1, partial [Symbiodinium microadriaticum]
MDPVSPTEASTRMQTLALYLELGGTPPKVLDFLTNFGGHAALSQVVLVHIQAIIVDVGIAFAENDAWTLVAGKKAGEWRGRAIAFRSSYTHTATTIHHRACSVVISDGKHKWGIISGHIPHHATLDETQEILQDWQTSKAMVQPNWSWHWIRARSSLNQASPQAFREAPRRGEEQSYIGWPSTHSL